MILSPYHTATRMDDNSLALYSLVTGRLHVTTEAIYKQLQDGKIDNIDKAIVKELKSSRILLESLEDSIMPYYENDKLRLVVLPTNRCNLRCVYCGELKGLGNISTRIMDDIICFTEDRLAENRKIRRIQVDWFGGEPTLDISAIQYLSQRFMSLAEKYEVSYHARIVTNGIMLTDETIRVLVASNVSFVEITIDGYGQMNNSRRKNAGGEGFYDRIIQNIEWLCDHYDITVSIRCNTDQQNKTGVIPLMADLKRRGLHQKVRFYLASIHSWGTESGSNALPIEEFAALQYEVLEYQYQNGFNITTNDILPFRMAKRECAATDSFSFVIDHHGFIHQCSETPYTENKKAVIGHVSRRCSELIKGAFAFPQESILQCKACPIYPICSGGCPKRCVEHRQPECLALKYNIHQRVRFFLKTVNA